jgi:hypothetical protein
MPTLAQDRPIGNITLSGVSDGRRWPVLCVFAKVV